MLSALYAIEQDAKEMNRPLEFCFVTEEQKEILENTFAGRTESSSDAGDYDYIYGQPELSVEEHIIRRRTTFPNLKGHMRIICSVK